MTVPEPKEPRGGVLARRPSARAASAASAASPGGGRARRPSAYRKAGPLRWMWERRTEAGAVLMIAAGALLLLLTAGRGLGPGPGTGPPDDWVPQDNRKLLRPPPALQPPAAVCPSRSATGPGRLLLQLVRSGHGPAGRRARDAVRDTWGGVQQTRRLALRTVFVLGRPPRPAERGRMLGSLWPAVRAPSQRWQQWAELKDEAQMHQDLLVPDFEDWGEANNSLAALAALKWAAENCSAASFLIQTADNALLQPSQLEGTIAVLEDAGRQRGGEEHSGASLRRPEILLGQVESTAKADQERGALSHYARGPSMLMSRPALLRLLRAGLDAPMTPATRADLFVSGVCAARARLWARMQITFRHGLPGVSQCMVRGGRQGLPPALSAHPVTPQLMRRVWAEMARPLPAHVHCADSWHWH